MLGVVLGNELGSENGIVLGMVELVELPGLLLVSRGYGDLASPMND